MIKINFVLLQPTKTSFEALLKRKKKKNKKRKAKKPTKMKKKRPLFLGETDLFQKFKPQISDGHFPLVSSHANLQKWTTS